jgi:hypothetical protein
MHPKLSATVMAIAALLLAPMGCAALEAAVDAART